MSINSLNAEISTSSSAPSSGTGMAWFVQSRHGWRKYVADHGGAYWLLD